MCKTHATLKIQQKKNIKSTRNLGPEESLLNRKDTFDVLYFITAI